MMSQRTGKLLTIFLTAIFAGIVTFTAVRVDKPIAVSPASVYDIPALELDDTMRLAQKGNCQAGERLAGYHMNVTLNFDSALKWGRVAARCSEVSPKVTLLVLLLQLDQTPAITKEIDTLVDQISIIDHEEANRVHDWVEERRKWLSHQANG